MFPPPPAYNRGTQRGSSSTFYEHNDNEKNVAVNAAATKPETNTSSQTDEEAGGAPESSKRGWRYSLRLVVSGIIIAFWLAAIVTGGVSVGTSINTYCLRDKEAAFRADCVATGGTIEDLDYPYLPFWRTGRIDCRHYGDEGKETTSFEIFGRPGGRAAVRSCLCSSREFGRSDDFCLAVFVIRTRFPSWRTVLTKRYRIFFFLTSACKSSRFMTFVFFSFVAVVIEALTFCQTMSLRPISQSVRESIRCMIDRNPRTWTMGVVRPSA
jgi:hypothetical protein